MSVFVFPSVWELAKGLLLSKNEANLKESYAIPTESLSDYKENMVAALIKRMYQFCQDKKIKLIILDIPSPLSLKQGLFKSSVPSSLTDIFRQNSDFLIVSEQVLGAYRGLVDTHLPHGHRHISEFSHLLFGVSIGRYIIQVVGNEEID